MDMNNKLTLDNVAEFIEKNNEKIIERIGTGGSTSISQETGNAITEKSDGIFVQDYSTNIANLENRSVIGSELAVANIKLSANITLDSADKIIPFNVKEGDESIVLNSDGSVTLKVGSKYLLIPSLFLGSASSWNNFSIVKSYDSTVLQKYQMISTNLNDVGTNMSAMPYTYEVTNENDATICIKAERASNQTVNSTYSNFTIVEVGRTYIVDPVKTAQEHEVKFGAFTTTNVGTLSANTPLVIDTIVSGNMELNSAKTGIKLEANKKYKISLNGSPLLSSVVYGGVFVYDLTHNRVTTNMICNSTTINTNGSYFNTGSGTFLETTEDLEISVYFNSSVSEVIDNNNGTFNILVEEIKNPVVVEYNSIGFTTETLWEGDLKTNDGTVTLVNSYTDYAQLYVMVAYNGVCTTYPIIVDTIVNNTTLFGVEMLSVSSVDTTCRLKFTDNNTLKLTNSAGNVSIAKVIGIKSGSDGSSTSYTDEEVNQAVDNILNI